MYYRKLPEYDIKLRYPLYRDIGTIVGLLIFILVFIFSKEIKHEVRQRVVETPVFNVEEVEQTIQEKVAPPPAMPTIPIASEDDDIPEDLDYDIGEEIDLSDITPPPPPVLDEAVEFFVVEVKPQMIGGTKALYKKIKYPEMAKKAGVEGIAQIEFTVSKTGVPTDFKVKGERPKGLGFADAAIAALRQMRFNPGYQRDKPVPVRMSQTVRFTIN